MALDGITVGQLAAFVEVARLGNITRSAEAMFLTQPALTARLQRLERQIGVALLTRSQRGTGLTDAGSAFLPFAEQALDSILEGEVALERFGGAALPELRLGATPTVSTYILPPVTRRLVDAHAVTQLTVRTAPSEELASLVLEDVVEVAICRDIQDKGLESTHLYEEELIVVADPSHPLTRRPVVKLADLTSEILVLFNRSPGYHVLAEKLKELSQGRTQSIVDVDNSEASKRLVGEGIGITLLPRTAVSQELDNGSLRELRLDGTDRMFRKIVSMRKRSVPESGGVPSLMRYIRQEIKAMGLTE